MKSVKIIFFAFVLASIGIISSATFSSVNAVQCNPNTQNGGCGSGNGCSCTDKAAIKLGDYSSCTCGPTGGQEACYHTICPVGYYCSGSGTSAYCKPATPKPVATTTPTNPCVESCTTQRTCVIAGNCAGGTQKLESTNRCNTGSPSKYWCVKRVCSQICSGTPTPTPTIPSSTWRPTPTTIPTPVPPTPGSSAKCVATEIYSPNWTPITTAEFYNVLPNSQVYFCVKGSTSSTGTVATPVATSATSCSQVCTPANSCLRLSDCINKGGTANNKDCDPSSAVKYTCSFKTCSTVCTGATPLATTASQVVNFDKARFTINGVLRLETTTVRPNTQDFCDLYTIPANTYNFKVQGEIHHPVYGWL